MESQIFKLDTKQYPALRKKIISRTIISMVIALGVISFITFKDTAKDDLTISICLISGLLLYYLYILFKSVKKRKKIYESYTLTIDELNITRSQDGISDLQIPVSEISTIEKTSDSRFLIIGKSKALLERISIPYQICDYDRVEEILANFKPVTIKTKPNYAEKYRLLIILALIIPMLCVYVVDNKIVVSVSAAITVTIFIYSMFYMAKYRNTIKSWKRALWLYPLVLISILVVTYLKLIA